MAALIRHDGRQLLPAHHPQSASTDDVCGRAVVSVSFFFCPCCSESPVQGIFDLTQTSMGQDVQRIDRAGSPAPTGSASAVTNSGGAVRNRRHVPSRGSDLSLTADVARSRPGRSVRAGAESLRAYVIWVPANGEPVPDESTGGRGGGNLAPAALAQQHVHYLIADRDVDQACLTAIDRATEGASTFSF